MKVVIDDKIPYIREAIEKIADEVIYLPGSQIDNKAIKDADALIIRTRTHCNRELLEGSRVRFIATATIGFDHIDTQYCKEAGITWENAPGCNASSVAQYIKSSLILLEKEKRHILKGKTLGIVGVGHVGSLVAEVGRELGMNCLLCDPPRKAVENNPETFVSLNVIEQESDFITFHVPLNQGGTYNTFHLADEQFFQTLQKKPVILNTSRGPVVDGKTLSQALDKGIISDAVIDVWENEPNIDPQLLNRVYIGTPHIAGYSADGKANATRMSLDALCAFFHIKAIYNIIPPFPEKNEIVARTEKEAVLQIYNPKDDDRKLRENIPLFESLRGNYPLRRESKAFSIKISH